MSLYTAEFSVDTAGENSFTDITGKLSGCVGESQISNGIANVFLLSTTASLVICENEVGLLEDIIRAARSFAPDESDYKHNQAWSDNNGRSHVKATLYRQDLNIPVRSGKLLLGTWQSAFLLEFDLRPRKRRISVTITGD